MRLMGKRTRNQLEIACAWAKPIGRPSENVSIYTGPLILADKRLTTCLDTRRLR